MRFDTEVLTTVGLVFFAVSTLAIIGSWLISMFLL